MQRGTVFNSRLEMLRPARLVFISEDCRRLRTWEFSSIYTPAQVLVSLTFPPFMTCTAFMPFCSCCNPRPSWAFGGDITSNNSTGVAFKGHLMRSQSCHLPVPFLPTSTLCEADIYQYPLRGPTPTIPFARPPSTSTLWYEMTPSIVRGAALHSTRCRLA